MPSSSMMETVWPQVCYSGDALWIKGVRASQAKTPHGIRSLARDCDSPHPHRIPSPEILEVALVALARGPSTDESRRAAAALRYIQAMLTKGIHGASAP